MTIREKYHILDYEFYNYIKDIIETDIVQKMDNYIQHGSTTTLTHCLAVSYVSYRIAQKFNLDYISVARAALLHDFFLYDWHNIKKVKKLFEKHGYVHPKIALKNSLKYFELNELEKDIISKHMWPLTITKIPKYKETMLVSMVDKYVSIKEFFSPYFILLKNKI